VFAPLATFQGPGNTTIDVAAHWMRAVTSSYKSGTANADVGSSDAGSVFAQLVAPAGNGAGAPVDISTMPSFKTVVIGGLNGDGTVIVEVSEDGVSYAQVMTFHLGGGQSGSFYGSFARVRREGSGGISTPTVWMGASNSGNAGSSPTLLPYFFPRFLASYNAVTGFINAVDADEAEGGTITATLPAASSVPNGTLIAFSNYTTGGNSSAVEYALFAGDTLDGDATSPNGAYQLDNDRAWLLMASDGVNNWVVLSFSQAV
jgi:hypothetical protein